MQFEYFNLTKDEGNGRIYSLFISVIFSKLLTI